MKTHTSLVLYFSANDNRLGTEISVNVFFKFSQLLYGCILGKAFITYNNITIRLTLNTDEIIKRSFLFSLNI